MTSSHPTFASWLLKTRMSFYQDDALILPWWFGLCCWNYAIAGICLLWVGEPKWMARRGAKGVKYPYRTMAFLLIVVQAPLSYMADYKHMTHDSYWHVIDRFLALPLSFMEGMRFLLVAYHSYTTQQYYSKRRIKDENERDQGQDMDEDEGTMPMYLIILSACNLAGALLAFQQSTRAQSRLDHQGFIVWHTVWHIYPILACLLELYHFYCLGGWKQSTRKYWYKIHWLQFVGPVVLMKDSKQQKQKIL